MSILNKDCAKKQKGFTLIELAVVFAIVSVLAVGSVALFSEQKVNVEQGTTEAKLEVVKLSLLRFIEKNNYLPCPDSNVQGEAEFGAVNRVLNQPANFAEVPAIPGVPAQAETASSPSISVVLATPMQPARTEMVDTCAVNSGTVPFEDIGLSLSDVVDTNHNLFRYVVNQGVTTAKNIANCPVDSACFFNRNTSPAFDYTTEPVAGQLGVNNLRVCSGINCSGANLLSSGLVAVILANNKNANNDTSGLSAEEQENRDGDQTFIKANYVGEGSAYFDDLLVSISGAELKRGERKTFQRNSVVGGGVGGPASPQQPDIFNLGAGSSGTNVGTDKAIWDRVNKSFDFGEAAANKEVVLTYKTRAVGTWDQPDSSNPDVTSDTATVTSNGTVVEEYKYDFTDNTQDGVQAVSFVAGFTGRLETRNSAGDRVFIDITEGQTYNSYADYWVEEREFILTTDDTGKVDLEFAAGTTATYETIDFTDIELVYYDTPAPIPRFPSVAPIDGIAQTEGL